jgi:hypothetical protein
MGQRISFETVGCFDVQWERDSRIAGGTSMHRIRHNRKRWRTKWPWSKWLPLKIDERFCRECGFAYHEGPLPAEVTHVTFGSVSAVVYPSGGFRRGDSVVRIGRVRSSGKGLYLSEFVPLEELADVSDAILAIRDEVRSVRAQRASKGFVRG